MKKLALAAVAFLVIGSMTSCKKDYTCSCTYSNAASNYTITYPKVAKKDAKANCDALSSIAAASSGSCKLD